MGFFAGSIHIRGGKVQEILPGLTQLHKIHGSKFVVEEAPGDWCSIFPDKSGQDSQLAQEIMKLVQKPSINLVIHDSDILAVDIFDGTSAVQSFNSNPTYFGEKMTSDEVSALKTFPANLSFFVSPLDLKKIKGLFGSIDESPMVDDVFFAMSKTLGIPQAQYSYEMIEEGEYVSASRRSKMFSVPDKADEKAKEAEIKEKVKKLKKQSILLCEKKGGRSGGGDRFVLKTDVETKNTGVFFEHYPGNEKIVWSSGELKIKPEKSSFIGMRSGDVGFGYTFSWNKDTRSFFLRDKTEKTIYEFSKDDTYGWGKITPDKQFLLFNTRALDLKWLKLATLEMGLVDSESVLKEKSNSNWILGPEPFVGMKTGGTFALYDWVARKLVGYGRPKFPDYTEELLSQCAWRKESHELWENSEQFLMRFRLPKYRGIFSFYFDPSKKFVWINDHHFVGMFSIESLLAAKGEEIIPEWVLFYTGWPADRINEFSNWGGCGFPWAYDHHSELWFFADRMGNLRALDIKENKFFSFLTMPRKLEAQKLDVIENGKYLIVNGRIYKDQLKWDVGLQVYDLEKLMKMKKEDSSDLLIVKTKKS